MSALHRLKAYFGMVPADELDYPDYDDDYTDARADSYRAESDRDARYPDGDTGADAVRRARQPARGYPATAAREAARDGTTRLQGALAMETVAEPLYGGLPRGSAQVAMQSVAQHVPAQHVAFAPTEAPHPLARITTLQPRSYNEARTIGERYREGIPVIINLTEMDDSGAKRLVDFAAGLAFALRGSIDKVTNRVFLLSPPDVEVSAADRRRLAEGAFFGQA